MILQIRTLNQKTVIVDIEETKTVYDLKKELSYYPDVGVKPELQKIIYSGRVLVNGEKLSSYNINVKKHLVVMIKQTLEMPTNSPKANEKAAALPEMASMSRSPISPEPNKEKMVDQIVSMGYSETESRRALAASFYNPERAIQYLVEGIPTPPSTPEGDTSSTGNDDTSAAAFKTFRSDPTFIRLRNAIQENPHMADQVLQRVAQTNPFFLDLINEYKDQFFSMIIEGFDDEDSDALVDEND